MCAERSYLSTKSKALDAVIDKLENYEIHVSENGSDSVGAF